MRFVIVYLVFSCVTFFDVSLSQARAESLSSIEVWASVKENRDLLAGRFFDDGRFFTFLENHPKEAEKLANRWYGRSFTQLWLKKFRTSADDALLFNPGIADRADEFVAFASDYRKVHKEARAFEVRDAFEKYLGKTVVYRAMLVTPERAQKILQNGIISSGSHHGETGALRWFTSDFGPVHDMQDRVFGNGGTGGTISVTEFPEVGFAATLDRNLALDRSDLIEQVLPEEVARKIAAGARLHLFQITTSEMNLVRQNQLLAKTGLFKVGEEDLVVHHLKNGLDEAFKIKPGNGQLESFMFNHVPPKEIKLLRVMEDLGWFYDWTVYSQTVETEFHARKVPRRFQAP